MSSQYYCSPNIIYKFIHCVSILSCATSPVMELSELIGDPRIITSRETIAPMGLGEEVK